MHFGFFSVFLVKKNETIMGQSFIHDVFEVGASGCKSCQIRDVACLRTGGVSIKSPPFSRKNFSCFFFVFFIGIIRILLLRIHYYRCAIWADLHPLAPTWGGARETQTGA